jgi:hypothetical protein
VILQARTIDASVAAGQVLAAGDALSLARLVLDFDACLHAPLVRRSQEPS